MLQTQLHANDETIKSIDDVESSFARNNTANNGINSSLNKTKLRRYLRPIRAEMPTQASTAKTPLHRRPMQLLSLPCDSSKQRRIIPTNGNNNNNNSNNRQKQDNAAAIYAVGSSFSDLTQCYEEIDQIYDYIRLPPHLRKLKSACSKSVDFEQIERRKQELLAAQQSQKISSRSQVASQASSAMPTTRPDHANKVPTAAKNQEPTGSRLIRSFEQRQRLLEQSKKKEADEKSSQNDPKKSNAKIFKVTAAEHRPAQVKRVESLNLNSNEPPDRLRIVAGASKYLVGSLQATNEKPSFRLPRAHSSTALGHETPINGRQTQPKSNNDLIESFVDDDEDDDASGSDTTTTTSTDATSQAERQRTHDSSNHCDEAKRAEESASESSSSSDDEDSSRLSTTTTIDESASSSSDNTGKSTLSSSSSSSSLSRDKKVPPQLPARNNLQPRSATTKPHDEHIYEQIRVNATQTSQMTPAKSNGRPVAEKYHPSVGVKKPLATTTHLFDKQSTIKPAASQKIAKLFPSFTLAAPFSSVSPSSRAALQRMSRDSHTSKPLSTKQMMSQLSSYSPQAAQFVTGSLRPLHPSTLVHQRNPTSLSRHPTSYLDDHRSAYLSPHHFASLDHRYRSMGNLHKMSHCNQTDQYPSYNRHLAAVYDRAPHWRTKQGPIDPITGVAMTPVLGGGGLLPLSRRALSSGKLAQHQKQQQQQQRAPRLSPTQLIAQIQVPRAMPNRRQVQPTTQAAPSRRNRQSVEQSSTGDTTSDVKPQGGLVAIDGCERKSKPKRNSPRRLTALGIEQVLDFMRKVSLTSPNTSRTSEKQKPIEAAPDEANVELVSKQHRSRRKSNSEEEDKSKESSSPPASDEDKHRRTSGEQASSQQVSLATKTDDPREYLSSEGPILVRDGRLLIGRAKLKREDEKSSNQPSSFEHPLVHIAQVPAASLRAEVSKRGGSGSSSSYSSKKNKDEDESSYEAAIKSSKLASSQRKTSALREPSRNTTDESSNVKQAASSLVLRVPKLSKRSHLLSRPLPRLPQLQQQQQLMTSARRHLQPLSTTSHTTTSQVSSTSTGKLCMPSALSSASSLSRRHLLIGSAASMNAKANTSAQPVKTADSKHEPKSAAKNTTSLHSKAPVVAVARNDRSLNAGAVKSTNLDFATLATRNSKNSIRSSEEYSDEFDDDEEDEDATSSEDEEKDAPNRDPSAKRTNKISSSPAARSVPPSSAKPAASMSPLDTQKLWRASVDRKSSSGGSRKSSTSKQSHSSGVTSCGGSSGVVCSTSSSNNNNNNNISSSSDKRQQVNRGHTSAAYTGRSVADSSGSSGQKCDNNSVGRSLVRSSNSSCNDELAFDDFDDIEPIDDEDASISDDDEDSDMVSNKRNGSGAHKPRQQVPVSSGPSPLAPLAPPPSQHPLKLKPLFQTSPSSSSAKANELGNLRLFDEKFSGKFIDQQLASSSDSLLESINFSGSTLRRNRAKLSQPIDRAR